MKRRSFIALAAAPAVAPLLVSCSGDSPQVEVFTWWTGPGEGEGLAELERLFKEANPDVEFVNAAIAGGGGDQARAALATRLQASDPPDSFQGHAGEELADYVDNGVIEDLSALFESEGWNDVMHPGLLENITRDGKVYAVPVNIHRANLLWYNVSILEEARLSPPQSWSELIEQNATLSEMGVTTLSIGSAWTQLHLMETVLLGELGAETYSGLWTGQVDWRSAEVVAALETFTEVLKVSNVSEAAADWQPQLDKIVDGTAAYAVMGDWVYSYLTTNLGLVYDQEYSAAETPGSVGVFDYLSDAFTLPVGAKQRENAEAWLKVCASVEGQDAFNTKKGSLPARTDTDQSLYTDYLEWNLGQWLDPATVVVGSLAHGAVARPGWKTEIETALGVFVQEGDAAAFAAAVADAYQRTTG
ncbi:glucose/mannose transport system substrate-binding protein [Stackebrandtia albiflava]|uniref:Probable sugar-binding periplasmic protein n=1 Tax=Stackebrandtia albiflava TaxID=406432 RepID=A0A562UR52_9ACTN|nr:ABC transporter substrate-binding protein [Stackebrandtia albiflava]TWJ08084.1 glucose/mannose transport system substrate-binding protein [Stackebrandtia albiflava]